MFRSRVALLVLYAVPVHRELVSKCNATYARNRVGGLCATPLLVVDLLLNVAC